MNFTILGSGGCVALPKPLCQCPVCAQAREKGAPYARRGCSLYCEDARLLIDTPEDINQSLNAERIKAIDIIAYSHWDPDHTLGMRVIEQLRLDFLAYSINDFHPEPIRVLALEGAMNDLNAIRSPYGPFMSYYENLGLIRQEMVLDAVLPGEISLTLVPVDSTNRVAVFVFQQGSKKMVYAPCDVKPFPESDIFQDADILVIGNTMVGPTLKDGFVPAPENPLSRELFSMEEIVALKARLNIPQVIVTHLEEDWGKSYDDYLALEKQFEGVAFAYDGMKVSL